MSQVNTGPTLEVLCDSAYYAKLLNIERLKLSDELLTKFVDVWTEWGQEFLDQPIADRINTSITKGRTFHIEISDNHTVSVSNTDTGCFINLFREIATDDHGEMRNTLEFYANLVSDPERQSQLVRCSYASYVGRSTEIHISRSFQDAIQRLGQRIREKAEVNCPWL